MNRLTKRMLQAAGVCAVVGMLTVAAPKAAHAITAALVQVVNTAANPAVTADVSRIVSQNLMLLNFSGFAPGVSGSLYQQNADGSVVGTPFTVPAGQNFVMTSLDVWLANSSGFSKIDLLGNTPRESFVVNSSQGTVQYQFPSGIVFGPNSSLSILNGSESCCNAAVTAHGYLTSN